MSGGEVPVRGGDRPRARHEVDGGIPEQQHARPHPADTDAENGFLDSAERRAGPVSENQHDQPLPVQPPGAAATAPPAPAADTPSAGTPSTGTPSTGTPSAGTPAVATPAAGTPGADPEGPRAPVFTAPAPLPDPRDRSGARALFIELRALPDGSPEKAELRNRLVRMHLPLVEHLARRFRNRGEPLDDLTQVATIGLIKSVDRFDPDRGVEFSTYATPTVVGEIKRHFRDKGWAVRVPRRLQELRLSLTTATAELSQQHGRSPTVHELAERLGISEEEVLEGLESANAYSTLSLDVPDTDDESPAVADTLGSEDEALEGVEYRESLKPLLEGLPPREKRILLLRFFGNMTQSQIAQEVGISQMHVSRLLARTLAQLREKLLVEE